MGKGEKILTTALWALLLTGMAAVVVGKFASGYWAAHRSALPVLYPAAQFDLIDQNAKPITTKDLRGRPWVAAFIFTQCGGICPQMTRTMVGLQKQLSPDVRLVSFSVDPEHDAPAVLKQYAQTYQADESRWSFLTGTKPQMFDVAAGMKIAAKPAEGDNPILHSEKLILVDGEGNIRGYYDSTDLEALKRLVADAADLARDAGLGAAK